MRQLLPFFVLLPFLLLCFGIAYLGSFAYTWLFVWSGMTPTTWSLTIAAITSVIFTIRSIPALKA